ncbi:MAG TPA: hypothetical protein VND24_11220, partial [Steroidobacteraceae bacterium]|nr:hypothetical protein [Steroidobacteraceae bacterium]
RRHIVRTLPRAGARECGSAAAGGSAEHHCAGSPNEPSTAPETPDGDDRAGGQGEKREVRRSHGGEGGAGQPSESEPLEDHGRASI